MSRTSRNDNRGRKRASVPSWLALLATMLLYRHPEAARSSKWLHHS
ncbi:hypothetical protein ACFO9Q_10450 [Paenibacillus sp. GCM10023252]